MNYTCRQTHRHMHTQTYMCMCVYIYTHIYIYLSVRNKCTQFLVVSDCDPTDCSTPGSSIHGIFQSRVVEWVAISYSRGIFLTQGLNLCLLCVLNWQTYFLSLCHLGSPYVCVYIYIYIHTHTHTCCCCCVASVVSDSVRPHRQQPTQHPVPGILQARTLEWVAISFSNAWKW